MLTNWKICLVSSQDNNIQSYKMKGLSEHMSELKKPTLKDVLAWIQEIERLDDYRKERLAEGIDTFTLNRRMQELSQQVSLAMQGKHPFDEDYVAVQKALKAIREKMLGSK